MLGVRCSPALQAEGEVCRGQLTQPSRRGCPEGPPGAGLRPCHGANKELEVVLLLVVMVETPQPAWELSARIRQCLGRGLSTSLPTPPDSRRASPVSMTP